MMPEETREVVGTVARRSNAGTGLVLEAEPTTWYNVSKYRPLELPPPGTLISMTVTGERNYIETLTVHEHTASRATPPPSALAPAADVRELRIVRESVLRTAVALVTAGGIGCNVSDVLDVAAELETWVLR